MMKATVKTPGDVPMAVAAMLGFMPSESLVVVGLGGHGPTARVDLGPESVESLAPAARHWAFGRVMILVYSDTETAEAYASEFADHYPLVDIVDVLTIRDGMVTSAIHDKSEPLAPIAPGVLGDRLISDSREALIESAERITDADEAVRLAEGYYSQGNGAMAWIYADRARALGGDPSATERALMHADDPKDRE